MTPQKRKKIETLVFNVMSKLDPTGINTEKYKKKFKSMNDTQFNTYIKKLLEDENSYFFLDVVDYERDLKMEHIQGAADVLGIQLFEKLALPMVNMNKETPIITKHPVPWGYIPVKRLQQVISKKNTTSTSIDQRSALVGQVVREDKNARDSDAENFALATIEAFDTLEEFMSPRADDMVKKREMYGDIARKGYTNLSGLTENPENKVTLNTVDVMFIGMGIKTDLVTEGLVLTSTLNNK